jgi:hypothetical protein
VESARIFLSKRFDLIFSDVDIDMINNNNNGTVETNFVYYGTCAKKTISIRSRYNGLNCEMMQTSVLHQ